MVPSSVITALAHRGHATSRTTIVASPHKSTSITRSSEESKAGVMPEPIDVEQIFANATASFKHGGVAGGVRSLTAWGEVFAAGMPALTIAVGAMCAAALVVWLGVGFGGVSSLVKSITSAWST
jgi:hypothetical protein